MKKNILFLALLLPILSYSQSYLGYSTDNYNGVHGVLFNPANIVDSNFKTDINVFSFDARFDNDYIGINVKDMLKGKDLEFGVNASKSPSNNNTFYQKGDYLGPSFMMNISPKHSIALFTRVQSVSNLNNINGELYEQIDTNFDSSNDFSFDDNGINATQHAWGEIGVSYATILVNKNQHFLKGGLSVKYLQGIFNSYIKTDHIHVDYDASATGAELDTQGTLEYAASADINADEFKLQKGANGLGLDFGFIYEWRPQVKDSNTNKYKLKFGFAVTDIGAIKYDSFKHKKYQLNGTSIDKSIFDNNDFEDALQILADANIYSESDLGKKIKVSLPTALHINADWNIHKKWFLNANSDVRLTNTNKQNTNNIVTRHTLTPRFETKWFTAQMPISTTALKNTTIGFGFRAGPLFVGSGSILTNMMSKDSKALDIYFGLKIPIYRKK